VAEVLQNLIVTFVANDVPSAADEGVPKFHDYEKGKGYDLGSTN